MLTEVDYCPLSGDTPGDRWRYERTRTEPGPGAILIPGRVLPGTLTDAEAEHERAVFRGESWSRRVLDGRDVVVIWVQR